MQALIFDFDGLILDTEGPDFASWQEMYREHGVELPLEQWALILGGTGASDFDPYDYLEKLLGRPVDRDAIWIKRRKRDAELLMEQPILPGVEGYLADAKRLGLKLAVASSSDEGWVTGHLTRLGLIDYFDAIKTCDDVKNSKPDPELFLVAMEALGVTADQAIAFEDSPNGVLAAQRAGIFTVAVPNPISAQLSLDHADLVINSLAELSLEQLLAKIER
jgi:HAD superfamily hydrolase (TIGR01509 family)